MISKHEKANKSTVTNLLALNALIHGQILPPSFDMTSQTRY